MVLVEELPESFDPGVSHEVMETGVVRGINIAWVTKFDDELFFS